MKDIDTSPPATYGIRAKIMNQDQEKEGKMRVASFLERRLETSKLSQKEIAKMCEFPSPNIITMFKQGLSKIPIEKTVKLAKALDVDRVEFFKLLMSSYRPKEYEVIVEIMGDPINESERAVVNLLREVIPGDRLAKNPKFFLDKIREALDFGKNGEMIEG